MARVCQDCGDENPTCNGAPRCKACHRLWRSQWASPQPGQGGIDGAEIGKLRERSGIRVEDIAARLGLSPLQFCNWIEDQLVTPKVAALATKALHDLAREQRQAEAQQAPSPAPLGSVAVDLVGVER